MMTPHPRVLDAADRMARRIAELARAQGRRLELDPVRILDRSDVLPLDRPGRISPNGSCRLIAARAGWIAVNLPRPEDRDLVAAWTETDPSLDPWSAIAGAARTEPAVELVARGADLGLAVARLGEVERGRLQPLRASGSPRDLMPARLRVVDLSALWAGPLCGAILAALGHEVLKIESIDRPDPVRTATPALDRRLNGGKSRRAIRFERATLETLMIEADIIISSARPRAFDDLGLPPEYLFGRRPGLIWIAITGHGWTDPSRLRAGFGDDCAVAGGLVGHDEDGPVFAGDAVADPLTGLAAAIAALEAIGAGGGVFLDLALAEVSASV